MSRPGLDVEGAGPLRAAVVGVSTSHTCGVRDHAQLQAQEMERQGISCSMNWLLRTDDSLGAARSQVRAWTQELSDALARERPDVVLLHYSVFSYSFRGLPLFTHPALSSLESVGIPLVTVLHEYAYPWGRDGARGALWALTQRAALIDVMRASSAVVVTAPARADWLASRAWLPRRKTVVAPVFSNLPPPRAGSAASGPVPRIGLFGYSYESAAVSLVLDAMLRLQQRGMPAGLVLLGAPGRDSAVGERWTEGARERGLAHAPSFTGILSAQELSDTLASCELLLFADPSGPSPRKTTLAASLASGSAVVALDGPLRWQALIEADALRCAAPTADALLSALADLLGDAHERERLAARGTDFAERAMSVGASAGTVAALLRAVAAGPVG